VCVLHNDHCAYNYHSWLGGIVVRSLTSDSEVTGSNPTSNRCRVIVMLLTRDNSAFHPFGVGK